MRWLVPLVPACLTPYTADELPHAVTLTCLDVAVAPAATAPSGIVLEWKLGNRCDHHVDVDFTVVRVVAIDGDGHHTPLALRDPHHAVRPLPLGARSRGIEYLEYDAAAAEPIVAAHYTVELTGLETGDSHTLRAEVKP